MPDEIFQIRALIKRIGKLSPSGRTYLMERLAEQDAAPTSTPAGGFTPLPTSGS